MNLFICSLLFLSSFSVKAYFFDKAVIQYAGDIGKVSFGVEKEIKDYYWFSLHYGITPKTETSTRHETYTIKNNLRLYTYEKLEVKYQFYFGAAVFYIPGKHFATDQIDDAPDSYYRQSSFRALLYVGHEFNFLKKHTAYFESGVNDVWMIALVNNSSVSIFDHVTLSLGYKYRF